ncbi:beta-ketoacyl synthase [Micromonospora sp. KC721]|uniref:beta-ketoacyl-[acyl-carrier-protein] synthase family protein n=1 Tax=Micromonospora sp. KC721 TaxID=2530380 RepID=UPI001050E612|nr:beta-ketoacyl-[acyl-carrier-protein] synthase family protein [Micromonospora sp. KC721]TDB81875.1 beta-ketoacyl-[acyl-carrier-protein] synthase family protein [Micromonospora sp. KC721]
MTAEVVVSGYGVFTAFGFGEPAIRKGVFAGVPAFAGVTRFDASRYRVRVAAEYRDGPGAVPRQRQVLLRCARAALDMAGLAGGFDAAVLIGTQGDYTTINEFWRGHHDPARPGAEPVPRPDLGHSAPAAHADAIADAFGIRGRRMAFVNGCVASANAIIHGYRLIAAGHAEVAVCGGAYVVDEEFFAKFDSGRAFATDGRLRAFSADRSGLLLGDGAAVLVLEAARSARARSAPSLARVAGWGMASDAYHVCRPDPGGHGLAAAVGQALRRAGVRGEDVGYVNAHGTGTALNDSAETRALRAAFGSRAHRVPVSSTKTTTGHTLEAAGAVEAVITMLALRHGELPPTAGYSRPDPACDLDYVPNRARPADPRYALSVNSAFGGLNTALVLERR